MSCNALVRQQLRGTCETARETVSARGAGSEQLSLHPFCLCARPYEDVCEKPPITIGPAIRRRNLDGLSENQRGQRANSFRLDWPGSGRCTCVSRTRCERADQTDFAAIVERQCFAVDDARNGAIAA